MTNHTVLVVEDEEELRESMRDALEMEGYTVVAVNDGQDALEQLDRIDHLCLVLLDLLMPRMNGWDFFAKVRARPELASVPVVVHSSAPSRAPEGDHEGASEREPLPAPRLILRALWAPLADVVRRTGTPELSLKTDDREARSLRWNRV